MAYPHFLAKMLENIRLGQPGRSDFDKGMSTQMRGMLFEQSPMLDSAVIDLSSGSVPSKPQQLSLNWPGELPPLEGLPELREAIAAKFLKDHELHITPGEVFITHGAAAAAQLVFRTFIRASDVVVLPDPISPLYSTLAAAHGRIRWLSTWSDEGRLRFRKEELAKALRGAHMMVLVSPNNPNGAVYGPEELEEIAWLADHHRVLLLCDQVFEQYHYDGEPLCLATLPKAKTHAITIGGISKTYGWSGLRVGWLAGPSELVRCCVSHEQSWPVPSLCQQAALYCLGSSHLANTAATNRLESLRHRVFRRLQQIGFNASWPSGGFHIWFPVWQADWECHTFCQELASKKQVLLRPGYAFGPSGKGMVRMNFATEEYLLERGLMLLEDFMEGDHSITHIRRAA